MEATIVKFGRFTLHRSERRLTAADRAVHLGGRALDLLILLTSRPGDLFSFDEIATSVWNRTVVDDANVRTQVATLRKLLQDDVGDTTYIANIPRRGYCFVAPISRPSISAPDIDAKASTAAFNPPPQPKVFGREDDIQEISWQLPTDRIVTIVGPGGIGKSTVAISALAALHRSYRDGIVSIDLSSVASHSEFHQLVASRLQLSPRNQRGEILRALQDKEMLFLIDSCEHLIDAVAAWIEDTLPAASGIKILATSREPLRVRNERVHRLGPLSVPASANLNASSALGHASVQLFVERAASRLGRFELSDRETPLVAEICRRLDGNALAIELAAGRLETMGVSGLAASLDNSLGFLTHGRRTALPRHQSMRATLDWSYRALAAAEQVALQYSSIFKGEFTFNKLRRLYPSTTREDQVEDALFGLVSKSMVLADVAPRGPLYRLAHTTRAYASEKLMASGSMARFLRNNVHRGTEMFGYSSKVSSMRDAPKAQ